MNLSVKKYGTTETPTHISYEEAVQFAINSGAQWISFDNIGMYAEELGVEHHEAVNILKEGVDTLVVKPPTDAINEMIDGERRIYEWSYLDTTSIQPEGHQWSELEWLQYIYDCNSLVLSE